MPSTRSLTVFLIILMFATSASALVKKLDDTGFRIRQQRDFKNLTSYTQKDAISLPTLSPMAFQATNLDTIPMATSSSSILIESSYASQLQSGNAWIGSYKASTLASSAAYSMSLSQNFSRNATLTTHQPIPDITPLSSHNSSRDTDNAANETISASLSSSLNLSFSEAPLASVQNQPFYWNTLLPGNRGAFTTYNNISGISSCSGILTSLPGGPVITTVTSTTTITVVIIVTVGFPATMPTPTLITPLPYCVTLEQGCLYDCFGVPFSTSTSTLLVTKKIPVISFTTDQMPVFAPPTDVAQPDVALTQKEAIPGHSSMHLSVQSSVTSSLDSSSPTSQRGSATGDISSASQNGIGGIIASVLNSPWTIPKSSSAGSSEVNPTVNTISITSNGGSTSPMQGDSASVSSTNKSPATEALATSDLTVDGIPVSVGLEDFTINSQGASPTSLLFSGQTFQLGSSRLVASSTTLFLPATAPEISSVAFKGPLLESSGTSALIPQSSQVSTLILKGNTFLVNPSQIIASDLTVSLPSSLPANTATPIVVEDQTLSADSLQLIAPFTTIPLVSSTLQTAVLGGQTFIIEPSQIIAAGTTVTFPQATQLSSPSQLLPITVDGIAFSLDSAQAIIGSTTYPFSSGLAPTTVVEQSQTISIGSNGIGFAGTTIVVPTKQLQPTFTAFTQGDLTISVAPSEVVIDGTSLRIPLGAKPTTTLIGSQIVSIGPNGIGIASATIPLPTQTPLAITVDGISISVAPFEAVIDGTTFHLISVAVPITKVIDDQSISIGASGIGLASTTILVPTQIPSAMTVDGLIFSLAPSEALMSGTAYAIGPGAPTETIVAGVETLSIGPNGIGFPDTTVVAASATMTIGVEESVGAADRFTVGNWVLLEIVPMGLALVFALT